MTERNTKKSKGSNFTKLIPKLKKGTYWKIIDLKNIKLDMFIQIRKDVTSEEKVITAATIYEDGEEAVLEIPVQKADHFTAITAEMFRFYKQYFKSKNNESTN